MSLQCFGLTSSCVLLLALKTPRGANTRFWKQVVNLLVIETINAHILIITNSSNDFEIVLHIDGVLSTRFHEKVSNVSIITRGISITLNSRKQFVVTRADISEASGKINHSILLCELTRFSFNENMIKGLYHFSGNFNIVECSNFKSPRLLIQVYRRVQI